MSSSPTPFAVSPSPSAEIRSQAIAKLKRAASLPRNPDGRRALQLQTPPRPSPAQHQVSSNSTTPLGLGRGFSDDNLNGSSTGHSVAATPTSIRFEDYGEPEELLDQCGDPFDFYGNGTMMQRSASDSSGFIPQVTYSNSSTPFYSAQPSPVGGPGPDWAAYQLAQSYLPSISPIPTSTPPSAFPGNLTASGAGRNTPSPLPTLGELRNLSRSNSAAARANAMNKLTGGAYTPTPARSMASSTPASSEEYHDDVTLGLPGARPSLHRAGTIGIPRMFGLAVDEPVDDDVVTPPTAEAPIPDTAFDVPRPRLQRSFTVSSSNMGEERRSAVGRRMVERLAERRAARQKEEQEVRVLWEERRRTKQLSMVSGSRDSGARDSGSSTDQQRTPLYSPQAVSASAISPLASIALLGRGPAPAPAAAAANNRNSEPSEEGAFEFESHLNRSVSTRTARGEVINPTVPSPLSENGDVYDDDRRDTRDYSEQSHSYQGDHEILETHDLPSQPFAGPSRHTTQSSTSSQGTVVPLAHSRNDVFRDRLGGKQPPNGSSHTENMRHAPHARENSFDRAAMSSGTRSDGHGHHDDVSSNASVRAVSPMSPREPAHSHADHRQHKQNSSISKQIGRNMLAVLRKRSGSRSSNNHDGPVSPGISRQASDESVQNNPNDRARHQGSNGSATPATPDHLASSTASSAQQHQRSRAASPNFLPRANPNDPRVHNSKLSPFPGIQALEQQKNRSASEPVRDRNNQATAAPRTSADDSGGASSSHGHGSSSHGHGQSLHTRGVSDDRSADHSTYTTQTSWSQSGHSHTPSQTYSQNTHGSQSTHGTNGSADVASNLQRNASRSRPEIPAYMTTRRRAPPPPPIELGASNVDAIDDDPDGSTMPLSIKSQAVISRMNALLALSPSDPSRPDFLDDPPRKLLLAQQVLQVVNSQTVKDRYLFLFNDILVIAKPLITQGAMATLDMQFSVKSIVSLSSVAVSGITDEPTTEPPRHPLVRKFITSFADDPLSSVQHLMERSNPKIDTVTLGSLLFRTYELDKAQLGLLLADDQPLLSTFVDRFHFEHMSLDDALRVFILAVRLPTDVQTAEALLRGFAIGYHRANEGQLPYDLAVAQELVIAVLSLNDMLYSTFGFAFPNHGVSVDRFIHSFRNRDLHHQVPVEMLEDLYYSIRNNKLVQALSAQEAHLIRDIQLEPSRPSSKLTFNDWSDPISVTIPQPDQAFGIKLLGSGLEFDPPFLDFSNTNEASFRVRGTRLGPKSMLFGRVGTNAELYPGLGNSRAFHVERAFMRHTFQIAFMSQQGVKRKYCFSVPDAAARQRWGSLLSRQIWLTTETKIGAGAPPTAAFKVRRAAEAVGLQVLRDALIKEGKEDATSNHGHGERPGHTPRKGSVSVAYAAGDNLEKHDHGAGGGMAGLQTGKELVLLCRQNSLLPGVLELLQSGAEPRNRYQPPANINGGSTAYQQQAQNGAAASSGSLSRSHDLKAMMDARRL